MSETNPEIEASLEELSKLVCGTLQGETNDFGERHEGLLKTLLMSGYDWKSNQKLMVNIEHRVKARCGQQTSHRGGELSAITSKLGQKFESMARMDSSQPKDDSPSKAANISAATDA